jgi:hypothetical protein
MNSPKETEMKQLLSCRRTIVSLVGMTFLLVLGLVNKVDVSMTIAAIVASIAAANASQKILEKKENN